MSRVWGGLGWKERTWVLTWGTPRHLQLRMTHHRRQGCCPLPAVGSKGQPGRSEVQGDPYIAPAPQNSGLVSQLGALY